MSDFTIQIAPSLNDISQQAWDACLDPHETNPFLSHAFLSSLENTGCAIPQTGWSSAHILVQSRDGQLLGACPCYIKMHSMGEYVFDRGWAEAYERSGGNYYPKLQICVPFTPATGNRFLIRNDVDKLAVFNTLIAGIQSLCATIKASSAHITFATHAEWETLGLKGFLQRTDQQFHWINENYRSFDDFLNALSARKRKNIKKERRDALQNGITIERLTATDLKQEHFDAFYGFYIDTGNRKWGRPYLTRAFFSDIVRKIPDQILLIMAKREGRYIAGALNFIGSHTLYGRNWGAIEDHPFLHFEVCYYQAIEFAIERGLTKVEAGAQGEHKLARGYRPTLTYSAHYIPDPHFCRAVADYLTHEREHVNAAKEELSELMPFKN